MNDYNNGFCSYDGMYNNGFQLQEISGIGSESNCFTHEDDLNSHHLGAQQSAAALPFVQIHTTNVQPSSTNFGNIFRRNQNTHEIKSEPIKSEQNDPNQNIPVTTQATTVTTTVLSHSQAELVDQENAFQVQRCLQCPFLALSEDNLNNHISNVHSNYYENDVADNETTSNNNGRKKIQCPGCDNIFYAKNSIETHLEHDHLMSKEDVNKILQHILKDHQEQRKSRIYLKNVEYLREPRSTEIMNEDNSLGFSDHIPDFFEDSSLIDNILHHDSFVRPSNRMKQKISIKSVDVLREPSLLNERSPKPKIYIKNVDILKEPLFLSTPISMTNTLLLNDNLNSNLFQIPQPVSSSSEELRGSYNSTPNDQQSPFDPYVETLDPPLPKENGKIYIRDTADMVFGPKRPNFIHLRTVDELNLMNKNDVEHLMAPNLDQNTENIQISSENSKNSEESRSYTTLPQISIFSNVPSHFQTNWTNEYGLNALDNIIDSSSGSVNGDHKNTHIDLNTPHVSSSSTALNAVEEDNDDPEMLFVCAQEIINENQEEGSTPAPMDIGENSTEIIEIIDDLKRDQPGSENAPIVEKGRIYVADNLMAEKKATRGRPLGSNRTGITKSRKVYGSVAEIDGAKCDVTGCAFRFKKPETMEYHRRCHCAGPEKMQCPECHTSDFSNWNTLHTHLWRTHKIDMDLYSCDLCNFKTPIYSRLANTHSKIHSEERNYKCDQCEKAFKNSKQLKNHRRLHRTPSTTPLSVEVHKCPDCGIAFSHLKTLKSHVCKDPFRCTICGREVSSKSALKLHLLTHESASKFKCTLCEYVTNDHNAFRRHKMTHEGSTMYQCPHCDYKSIQSIAYQKHIQLKHPEEADSIILKCTVCQFATINRSLYNVHLAKHDITTTTTDELSFSLPEVNATEINDQPRNKIKVKSDLVLTDPTKFSNPISHSVLMHNYCDEEGIT